MSNSLRHGQNAMPGSWFGSDERLAAARRLPQAFEVQDFRTSPAPTTGMQRQRRHITTIASDANPFFAPANTATYGSLRRQGFLVALQFGRRDASDYMDTATLRRAGATSSTVP